MAAGLDSTGDISRLVQPALEASSTAVVLTDADGTIVLANRALAEKFGYAAEELVGQSIELLLPDSLRSIYASHRVSFVEVPEARRIGEGREVAGRRKDGSHVALEISLNPMWTSAGLLVLASIVEVGERHRAENRQRAALEDELQFERFLAELSLQFINQPGDQTADGIRDGLRRVCEHFDLDCSSFFRVSAEGVAVETVRWTASAGALDKSLPTAALTAPSLLGRVLAGETVSFSALDEVPDESDRIALHDLGVTSAVLVPLPVERRVAGSVAFMTMQRRRQWTEDALRRLQMIAGVFDQVLARLQHDDSLRAASREGSQHRTQLGADHVFLRHEDRDRLGLTRVIAQSAATRRVLEQIQQVAATDSTVLLVGETGTGKELFATQIHELGARHTRPMVRVNCAAIPATLIESELFGREKGAFTGALARQIGRFELADHSTIFLDEIGDLPLEVQVKLLRVLEERTIERLGSPRPITVDVRIVAATHRDLEQRVADGAFREDFYYRLNVFPIYVPPLRERSEDIPLLVWRFVEEFSKAFGKRIDAIDRDSFTALQRYSWPGNIRELRNVVERAMIVSSSRRLSIPLPATASAPPKRSSSLVDVEKEHIRTVLQSTGWRIRGTGGAADRLGLKPTTLETRMAKLGLRRPGHE